MEDDFRRTGRLYEDLISQVIDQNRPQLLFPVFNAITTNQEKRHLMEHAAIHYVLSDKPIPLLSFFIELNDTFEAIKAKISIAKKCNEIKAHSASSDFLDQAQQIAILLASPEAKVEQLCEIACLRIALGQVEIAKSLQAEIQAVINNFSVGHDPDRAITKEIMQNQQVVVAFELRQPDEFRENADLKTNHCQASDSTIPSILDDSDVWEQSIHRLKQAQRTNHLLQALEEIEGQLLALKEQEERLYSSLLIELINTYFLKDFETV